MYLYFTVMMSGTVDKNISGRSQISVCMFFFESVHGECRAKFSLSDVDLTRSINGGVNG